MRCRAAILATCLALAAWPTRAADVDGLASLDAREREATLRGLMATTGLDDLGPLREELARRPRPLPAAMEMPLRIVVRHAHARQAALDAQREAANDATLDALLDRRGIESGFLGINILPFTDARRRPARPATIPGAVVRDVIPGFVAAATLEPGDVVTGLAGVDRQGRADGVKPVWNGQSLVGYLREERPGSRQRLFLVRGGRPVEVDVVLDQRVDDRALADDDDPWPSAASRAERRWQEDFAPLFSRPADLVDG